MNVNGRMNTEPEKWRTSDMCRKRAAALLLLTGLCLGGCSDRSGAEAVPDGLELRASVSIQKDGSIQETMKEEFDSAHYDEEELRSIVLSAVAGFNASAGLGDISVEQFENEEGVIAVRLNYPSDEAYTAFNTDEYNSCRLFCGTLEEAEQEGYSLDVELTDQKGTAAGAAQLQELKKGWVVITEQPLQITVPGKIRYCSKQVVQSGKNHAYIKAGEETVSDALHYIVFEK